MLGTFIDKVLALLDRRFLVAHWMPTFLLGLVFFFTAEWSLPWLGLSAEDYFALEGLRLSGVTLGLFLVVTLLAYLLRAFTRPLIRIYEGHWSWRWLQEKGIHRHQKRWQHLRQLRKEAFKRGDTRRYNRLQATLYRDYPFRRERIQPTRLGNVLRAAEDYPYGRYGLDGVFWWPRLEPLLPESLSNRLEAAFMGLVALLNLATLALVFALVLVGNAIVVVASRVMADWWVTMSAWFAGAQSAPMPSWLITASGTTVLSWLTGAFVSLLVGYIAYRGAVAQALSYGELIRVAYDKYRFLILDALQIPRPATPAEEHALWHRLYHWLYQQDLGCIRDLTYTHQTSSTSGEVPS